jgi:xylulokinase
VLGLRLERVAVEEGPAYGAALLGGIAAGAIADHEEAATLVHSAGVIEPNRTLAATYGQARETFKALYPALHPEPTPARRPSKAISLGSLSAV